MQRQLIAAMCIQHPSRWLHLPEAAGLFSTTSTASVQRVQLTFSAAAASSVLPCCSRTRRPSMQSWNADLPACAVCSAAA